MATYRNRGKSQFAFWVSRYLSYCQRNDIASEELRETAGSPFIEDLLKNAITRRFCDGVIIYCFDFARCNRILWKGLMGNRPYPAAPTGMDLRQNREELLASYRQSLKQ